MTSVVLVILLLIIAIGAIVVMLVASGGIGGGSNEQRAATTNLRNMVSAQREIRAQRPDQPHGAPKGTKENLAFAAAREFDSKKNQSTTAAMTLERRLRLAKWALTPFQFRGIQALVTILFFLVAYIHTTIFIMLMVLVLTPLLISGLLDRAIEKRFEAFDKDYPVLLMAYVSLLKTGMSALTGLEAAAKGLEENSLVRLEVELLIERLRLGLTEEQAIGAFGEDIAHPELELFVQSLILSRRVGGQLSQTLERLARQVRKRQQFRKQAIAAVGMERSSLIAVACIMFALMCYLTWTTPELVLPALSHRLGMKIFQCGIMLIAFGFYWSRQVTKIKI